MTCDVETYMGVCNYILRNKHIFDHLWNVCIRTVQSFENLWLGLCIKLCISSYDTEGE